MITLPWVSRARYTEIVDRANRNLAYAQSQCDVTRLADERLAAAEERHTGDVAKLYDLISTERARFQNLLDKFTMLKLQGFTEPDPVPVAPERKAFDPIASAIVAKFPTNRKLQQQARAQAKRDHDAGVSDDEIVQRIERGTPGDEAGAL